MLPHLLTALLLMGQTTITYEEAERLARRGYTAEAMQAFERLVAANPDDGDSRVWIGRLQQRVGRPDLAETTFRETFARDATRVDALVGLVGALVNQGRVEEALETAVKAEVLAPTSPDVLGAKARALRMAGRPSDAIVEYTRALDANPDDYDVRLGFEATRRQVSHVVDASMSHEMLAGGALPPASLAEFGVSMHVDDRRRVFGRAFIQQRSTGTEGRAGGGIEWRAHKRAMVRSAVLISPGADMVARADLSGEVEMLQPRWQPALTVRHLRFTGASVWVIGPAVTIDINDPVALLLRYYRAETDFHATGRHASDNAFMAAARVRAHMRLWLTGAYARGYESFERLSADRLGQFRADTIAGSARFDMGWGTSIAVAPEYQWRTGNRKMFRLTAAFVQYF